MPDLCRNTIRVRGLDYLDASPKQLRALLAERMAQNKTTTVFTPNAAIAEEARLDARLHRLLAEADLLLPDGAGIILASRRCASAPLTHRLPGIEAGEMALSIAGAQGDPVYLLGGKPGVAEAAARAWQQRLPALTIAGTHHGSFAVDSPENDRIAEEIQASGARVVLVCLGFPTQETWIVQNRDQLPGVRLFMGLGGSFDVWAGQVRRAPVLCQRLHLEWLWRMAKSPRKFARLPAMLRYVFGL